MPHDDTEEEYMIEDIGAIVGLLIGISLFISVVVLVWLFFRLL